METITVKAYKYDELEESAKEKALEVMSDINTDYEWYDCIFDDVKTIGKIIGIDIKKIYFSGFYSQGDGACFEGYYQYNKDSVKKLIEYAPKYEELRRIVTDLRILQGKNFYQLTAHVKHRGHYCHSLCTEIDIDRADNKAITVNAVDDLKELLRDFMNWIYRTLERENNYLCSRDAIEDTIRANEYLFTAQGKRDYYL